jgi:hypothetical protein
MALSSSYVNVYGKLGEVFNRIAEGQAPEKFTTQYLKDLGSRQQTFAQPSRRYRRRDGEKTQRLPRSLSERSFLRRLHVLNTQLDDQGINSVCDSTRMEAWASFSRIPT